MRWQQLGLSEPRARAAFLSAPRQMHLGHIGLQVLLSKLTLGLPVLLPG